MLIVPPLLVAAFLKSEAATSQVSPVRRLVFAINLTSTAVEETRGSGPISNPVGSNIRRDESSVTDARGTIVCDIVATLPSGDLLVDVSEDLGHGHSRGDPSSPAVYDEHTAPARIGVHADGALLYPQGQGALNEEEIVILKLLALDAVGPSPRTVGETWTVTGGPIKNGSVRKYRVTAVPAPDDERILIEEDFRVPGVDGYSGTRRITMSYDPSRLAPRTASVLTMTRSGMTGNYRSVTIRIDYRLKEYAPQIL